MRETRRNRGRKRNKVKEEKWQRKAGVRNRGGERGRKKKR